ncbi:MAG: dodecin domain-containing protein [Alphaproteobacteria bacterium]|nr:dodecin domain-containing protein [Alphaproteobacteria bacterium]
MSEHVYKIIELAGSSPVGIEQAIGNAVAKADSSLRNLRWFQVNEIRGQIEDGEVAHWQVVMRVGFTLDDEGDGKT